MTLKEFRVQRALGTMRIMYSLKTSYVILNDTIFRINKGEGLFINNQSKILDKIDRSFYSIKQSPYTPGPNERPCLCNGGKY